MTDISKHLPEQSKTVEAIFAHYKEVGDAEPARRYLGASIIGHPCERYLWYCFRRCCKPEFSGRMYRLFATGDLEEDRFIRDLRAIGCTVYDVDENYSRQFEVSTFGGHFSGHMDSAILGVLEAPKTWHVGEYKTHNAKSFAKLTKEGVQKSKPQHYAQMMVYMHLTGMKRALYLARNKDTDDLYSERIRYDKVEAEALMERAKRIITLTVLPRRISDRPDFYQCNWCDAKEICWGGDTALPVPSLSCRQCCHATPVIEGVNAQWTCEDARRDFYDDKGWIGPCDRHLILPGLIPFAEPTDYGKNEEGCDFIEFANEDGTKWGHGNAAGCYSSEELMKLPASALTNEMMLGMKDFFKARIIDCTEDLLHSYPKETIVWSGPSDKLVSAWRTRYAEELLELTPIARDIDIDYNVIELKGNRIAVIFQETETAEIRERTG